MNPLPSTGAFEIHSSVNITWLRLGNSDLHCFALREIDETIFKKLQRTQSDLDDAASDTNQLQQKLGDSTNVSLRHACSCLNIPLYPAMHEEIVELKRAEAIGCRAPCASLILGGHLVHVLQAFGRKHFARVIRTQLETLGDGSLDSAHDGTIPGRNASDHPKKKKGGDDDLVIRKASTAAIASKRATAAAAAAVNPSTIASNTFSTTTRRSQPLQPLELQQTQFPKKDLPSSSNGSELYYDEEIGTSMRKKTRRSTAAASGGNNPNGNFYEYSGSSNNNGTNADSYHQENQFVQLPPSSVQNNASSNNNPNNGNLNLATLYSPLNPMLSTTTHASGLQDPNLFQHNSQLRVNINDEQQSLHDEQHQHHQHHQHLNIIPQPSTLLPTTTTLGLTTSLTNHHTLSLYPNRPQSALGNTRDSNNNLPINILLTPSHKTHPSNEISARPQHNQFPRHDIHIASNPVHSNQFPSSSLLHQPQHQPAFTLKDSFHGTPAKMQPSFIRPISAHFSPHSQSTVPSSAQSHSSISQHNHQSLNITNSSNTQLTTSLQQTFSAIPHQLQLLPSNPTTNHHLHNHSLHNHNLEHLATAFQGSNQLPSLHRVPTGQLALLRNNSNISSSNIHQTNNTALIATIASNPLHQPSSKDHNMNISSLQSIQSLSSTSSSNLVLAQQPSLLANNIGNIPNFRGNQSLTTLQHTNSLGFVPIPSDNQTSASFPIAGRPFSGASNSNYQQNFAAVTRPTSAFFPQNQLQTHQNHNQHLISELYNNPAPIQQQPKKLISFMVSDDNNNTTPISSTLPHGIQIQALIHIPPTAFVPTLIEPLVSTTGSPIIEEDDNDGNDIQELIAAPQPILPQAID